MPREGGQPGSSGGAIPCAVSEERSPESEGLAGGVEEGAWRGGVYE